MYILSYSLLTSATILVLCIGPNLFQEQLAATSEGPRDQFHARRSVADQGNGRSVDITRCASFYGGWKLECWGTWVINRDRLQLEPKHNTCSLNTQTQSCETKGKMFSGFVYSVENTIFPHMRSSDSMRSVGVRNTAPGIVLKSKWPQTIVCNGLAVIHPPTLKRTLR